MLLLPVQKLVVPAEVGNQANPLSHLRWVLMWHFGLNCGRNTGSMNSRNAKIDTTILLLHLELHALPKETSKRSSFDQ
jgi:hypothetical protein